MCLQSSASPAVPGFAGSGPAAATRVTDSIELTSKQRIKLSSLQPWLHQHAEQLTTLHLDQEKYKPTKLYLPCGKLTKLQALRLNTLHVKLLPASSSSSSSKGRNRPLLPALQQLELCRCQLDTLEGLLQLARSTALTSLQLHCLDIADSQGDADDRKLNTGIAEPPQEVVYLPCLASLQDTLQLHKLNLQFCCVDPVVLGRLTRLQKLSLKGCSLLQQQDDQQEQEDADDSAEVRALLGSIAQLTHLQSLTLGILDWDVADADPQLFAALTSSRQLTRLDVEPDNMQPLPRGALQHMFPTGRRMPRLSMLNIACEDGEESDLDVTADGCCLDAADLERTVAACPRLHGLGLLRVVNPRARLHALLKLPQSLWRLDVGGLAFGDAAAATIAQLHRLRLLEVLTWVHPPELSDVGLQQLTALTGVTELLVMHCRGLSEDISMDCDSEGEGSVDVHSSYEKGPVWHQLQAMCANSPDCEPLGADDSDVVVCGSSYESDTGMSE